MIIFNLFLLISLVIAGIPKICTKISKHALPEISNTWLTRSSTGTLYVHQKDTDKEEDDGKSVCIDENAELYGDWFLANIDQED